MARTKVSAEFNTFVGGLITEASPLTFPDNSSLEEENFVLKKDGSRERRLGIEYESGSVFKDTGVDTALADVDTFLWEAVNENGSLNIGVVKVANKLWFVNTGETTYSQNFLNGGNPFIFPEAREFSVFAFADIAGWLVVTVGTQDIFVLSYDVSADLIVLEQQTRIQVRDFFGVDDGLRIDERLASLSSEHKYNLYNQGWPVEEHRVATGIAGGNFQLYHVATILEENFYPSSSDIWPTAQRADSDGRIIYDPRDLFEFNSAAPRGHFIIDLFNRGTSRFVQVNGSSSDGFPALDDPVAELPGDISSGKIVDIEPYASRVWYVVSSTITTDGDIRSPKISTFVYFSQLVDNFDQINKCHQENDPTSKDISDLLATDGGYIQLPEVQNPIALLSVARSILLFANNGVWEIRGQGSEESFTATSFQIKKLSREGAIAKRSVVVAKNTAYYFGEGGIFRVGQNEIGNFEVVNISQTTIQSFYDDIDHTSRQRVTGQYDYTNQTCRWLFKDSIEPIAVLNAYTYDTELVLDIDIGSWYVNKLPVFVDEVTSIPAVGGFLQSSTYLTETFFDIVTADGEIVTADGEIVSARAPIRGRTKTSQKYLVLKKELGIWNFTFGNYLDFEFTDWRTYTTEETLPELDAPAFLLTGYLTGGDTQRDKQANYLTVHLERTETGFELDSNAELQFSDPSSCLMQAQWEWTNSVNAGRWTAERQVYRYKRLYQPGSVNDPLDYGFKVITTKSKVRGRGKALSLKFSSEPRKDLKLLGWAMNISIPEEV